MIDEFDILICDEHDENCTDEYIAATQWSESGVTNN
jgi:hypothetical protein